MPRTCTLCTHPKRSEIDAALLRPDSLRAIAGRYGTSKASLARHRDSCISAQLTKAKELQETQGASDLVHRLQEINAETRAVLARAKKAKDEATVLRAITRMERQLELEAELIGALDRGARGPVARIEVVYVDKVIANGAPAPASTPAIEGVQMQARDGVYQKA